MVVSDFYKHFVYNVWLMPEETCVEPCCFIEHISGMTYRLYTNSKEIGTYTLKSTCHKANFILEVPYKGSTVTYVLVPKNIFNKPKDADVSTLEFFIDIIANVEFTTQAPTWFK